MNGRPIHSSTELRTRLGLTPIGEEIELRVARGGDTRSIRARIAAPQEFAGGDGRTVQQLPGMRVVEIERGSPLYQRVQGLVVASVEQGSRAWQAGFRAGDIIYAVNRKRVRTFAEFQKALNNGKRGYTVSLLRGDFNVTITVR